MQALNTGPVRSSAGLEICDTADLQRPALHIRVSALQSSYQSLIGLWRYDYDFQKRTGLLFAVRELNLAIGNPSHG